MIFILTDNYLNVEFTYKNGNQQIEELFQKIQKNRIICEELFGRNAFKIAKNMKTFSVVPAAHNDYFICSYAAPLKKENGEIICFFGVLSFEKEENLFLSLLINVLADLILYKLKEDIIKEKLLSKDLLDISLLTDKEKVILKLVSDGLTDISIANNLYVSVSTVRAYIASIYEKANIKNRAQLASSFILYELDQILKNLL